MTDFPTYKRRRPKTFKQAVPASAAAGHKTGAHHAGAPADEVLRNTSRWQKLRGYHIARHPLCAICGKPGELVHHKVLPSGTPTVFYDPANLVTVCTPCHGKVHSAMGRGLTWQLLMKG